MIHLFRKIKECVIQAPCKGILLPLEEVKDPIFAQKMMGDGFAVIPEEDTICAPCSGRLTMIANTSHAFGITSENGAELLVHVGLDTVNLQGKGFKVLAEQGQRVTVNTPILKLDLPYMKEQKVDLTIPVILTNGNEFQLEKKQKEGRINRGYEAMTITKN